MIWNRRRPQECQLCNEEAIAQRIPSSQRQGQLLPCPIHGHPLNMSTVNFLIWEMWCRLRGNHCTITEKRGKDMISLGCLDIAKVKLLSDAYDLDFLKSLDRLQVIMDEYNKELKSHG